MDKLVVTLAIIATACFVVWFFWGPRKLGGHVQVAGDGFQEANIEVKGRYSPDTVVVRAGSPIRLTFHRLDTAACSETVIFDSFHQSAQLPTGKDVVVTLPAAEPGKYEFTCAMGMLRGHLIVVEPAEVAAVAQ